MKKIIQLGDPVLETKTEKVKEIKSVQTQKLIDDMLEILNSQPEKSAGLSAPQIGVSLRVAVCRRIDLKEDNDQNPIWEIMINPEIISKSKEYSVFWEGCLSIKEGDLFGQVSRPKKITVKYYDRKGNELKLEADDYFAHVVQHEIDHLDGVLFLRYIDNPAHLYTGEELDRSFDE